MNARIRAYLEDQAERRRLKIQQQLESHRIPVADQHYYPDVSFEAFDNFRMLWALRQEPTLEESSVYWERERQAALKGRWSIHDQEYSGIRHGAPLVGMVWLVTFAPVNMTFSFDLPYPYALWFINLHMQRVEAMGMRGA